jgi:hypothetical protein
VAIGAFEGDGVAAAWDWFVVSSFNATLVPTSMGFSGVVSGANRAGGKVLFTHLDGVAKFVTFSALTDGG